MQSPSRVLAKLDHRPLSSQTARIARRRARPARRTRRALLTLAVVLAAVLVAFIAGLGPLGDAVREITLPLRHDDIIRQQAEDKDLDAALIAGVIYEESRFRDQTSHAGARGLMQITPDTADFIARHSGGILFEQSDLATPQINIAYGSFFLRYLIDHYEGEEDAALAAYNAGITNVDGWVAKAGGPGEFEADSDIPFPETRAYIENVQERRDEYREHYADDLGY
jgi:soluble lytic murein transglycosylase